MWSFRYTFINEQNCISRIAGAVGYPGLDGLFGSKGQKGSPGITGPVGKKVKIPYKLYIFVLNCHYTYT